MERPKKQTRDSLDRLVLDVLLVVEERGLDLLLRHDAELSGVARGGGFVLRSAVSSIGVCHGIDNFSPSQLSHCATRNAEARPDDSHPASQDVAPYEEVKVDHSRCQRYRRIGRERPTCPPSTGRTAVSACPVVTLSAPAPWRAPAHPHPTPPTRSHATHLLVVVDEDDVLVGVLVRLVDDS